MGRDATGRGGRDRGRRLACLTALLASGLAACAGTRAGDSPAAPTPRAVLLAPLSFNQSLPEKLERGVEVLNQEIRAQLAAQGIFVSSPTFQEFHDAWLLAASDVGSLYDEKGEFVPERFDAATRNLAAAWRERGVDFDVLLIPYLGYRPGTVTGQSVKWDGVAHRLPIEFEHGDVQHLEARRRFQAPCTSLRLLAFDRDGKRLFEQYGGLEVTTRAVIKEGRWGWQPRGDLFADRNAIREGVRVALQPLFE